MPGGEVGQLGLHGRVVREGDHRHPLAHTTQVRRHLRLYIQGVPYYWAHFVFFYFVSFYSTKIQKFGECLKIQEICYQIGTRILKIDLEIAEIIDVKVATYKTKIIFLPLMNSKMSASK